MNTEVTKKITIGNVCFIRDPATQRVLLLKRDREPMKELFTGVGGKTHFGEDIRTSCLREVEEETGLVVTDLVCRGILTTLLEGTSSSWILFLYTADHFTGNQLPCDEGELMWIPYDQVLSLPLIGFIREILPDLLFHDHFIEGTLRHDLKGKVLAKDLYLQEMPLQLASSGIGL